MISGDVDCSVSVVWGGRMPTETKGAPIGARNGLSPIYGNRSLLG